MHQHHEHQAALGPGFGDLWSPEMIVITLLLAALYLTATGWWRQHIENSAPVGWKKKFLFLMGLLFFYIAMGSPLNYYGHDYLFSAHMTQQSLLYLAMPPLLLIGTPEWLLQYLLRNRTVRKIVLFLTNPLIAVLSFNLLFSFYHLPFIFDEASQNHWFMTLYHVILVFAAFQMWWPIVSPLSDQSQLSDLRKLAYIFANGVLITPACALIIFSDSLLYSTYANAPLVFASHSALADQRLGGILMKLIQEAVYGCTLAYIFFRWYNKEKGIDIPDFNEASAGRMNLAADNH